MATNPIAQALSPFIWGRGGAALTPEQVAREREVAEALMAQGIDTSPVGDWTQGAARMANVLAGKIREGRASSAETAGRDAQNALRAGLDFSNLFGGGSMAAGSPALGGSPAASTAMTTAPAPDIATARVAQAHGDSGGSFLPASFLSALDRTEGGGNYDTLFGHAQRSGPFAGISVSQMPISEVLAFASPSGAYGQHVKSKVGRVATPMGRHQIVGTTLRNAVNELGIDPSTVFDAQTQDRIAGHLARKRLASSSTMDGKVAALRSEWEGFKSVPRSQLEVIIRDIESAPSGPVAANEAMASGELANPSLTPDVVQQWAAQNYAPEQAAGVTVAETPEEILAAEAAMASEVAPPLPQPTMVQDMPVADVATGPQGMGAGTPGETRRGPDGRLYQYAQTSGMAGATGDWGWIPVADDGGGFADVARALTGATVNPDLPMAGNTSGFLPIAQSLAAQSQGGGMPPMQQIMELASSPWATDMDRQIAGALIRQQMEQADPYRQAQLEKLRLETEALRNPAAPKPIEVGGVLLDPNTMQPIFDSRDNTPSNVREYEYYANAETAAGRQPMPFGDWDQSRRRSAATNVTTNVGGETLTPGQKKIDESFADTYLQWQGGGYADSAKQLDQLNESLGIIENAVREGRNISGVIGTLPNAVQPFINPEGTVAREGVEEVVQRSLREILGAQFTEKEGERLIARAYNPLLPPAENAKRVRRLIGQVQGMAEARQAMVDYFDNEGTLRGFKGKRPSLSQLENIESEWEREDNSAGRNDVPDKAPNGVDPQVWEFMTPEERTLFK